MHAEPALRYKTYRGSFIAGMSAEMQLMVRKKGGRRMKSGRQRIEIIPLWRDQPDARLFAEAVLALARQRRLAEQRRIEAADQISKEDGRG